MIKIKTAGNKSVIKMKGSGRELLEELAMSILRSVDKLSEAMKVPSTQILNMIIFEAKRKNKGSNRQKETENE